MKVTGLLSGFPAGLMAIGSLAALGCGHDEPLTGVRYARGKPGPAVAIDGQPVDVGFALGHMRETVELAPFQISRHPVTIGEYRGCVSAGACKPPHEAACNDWPERTSVHRPNFRIEGIASDAVATCVGLAEARQYCAWVGGRLPSLQQWLLAARGRSPQRFSWGGAAVTCEHHPFADLAKAERCQISAQDVARVGLHAPGASLLGIQDVLLTPGELLDTSPDALFSACLDQNGSKPGTDKACIVYGLKPGAIDSVEELWARPEHPDATAIVYGFRCTWGGAS